MPYSKDIVFLDEVTVARDDFNLSKKFQKYTQIAELLKDPNYFRGYKFRVNGKRKTYSEAGQAKKYIKEYKLRSENEGFTGADIVRKVFAAAFSIESSSECKQIAPVLIQAAIPVFLISSAEAECDWLEIKYDSKNQIETLKFGCTKSSDYKAAGCKRKFCGNEFVPSNDLKGLIDTITREIASLEILPLMNLSSFLQTLIWKHVFFPKILEQWERKIRERKTYLTYTLSE